MKINCWHGFFTFEEDRAGEISDFMSVFNKSPKIIQQNELFIFEALAEAPDFSIAGLSYLGVVATKNYEGKPWEVMRENQLIFNFNTGFVQKISTITQTTSLKDAGNKIIADGLILPGSIMDDGKRVTDYAAWFSTDTMRFKYSAVYYE